MLRIDESGCFEIPTEYDVNGIRINDIIIDENTLPKGQYVLVGPRKVDITLPIPKETKVFAEIEHLNAELL
jgi:hypothetical protein